MRISPLSSKLILAWTFAALVAATTGGYPTLAAAEGYWRYVRTEVLPLQSELDATRRANGGKLEMRVSGAFQAKYAGKGSLDLYFKTQDPDGKVYLTTMLFTFGTSTGMSVLKPGDVLSFEGSVAIKSNYPGAFATGGIAVGNGDYFLSTRASVGKDASGSGKFTVTAGGDTTWIQATAYLAHLGSLKATVTNFYEWVEGPVPPSAEGPPDGQGSPVLGGEILGPQINIAEIEGWSGTWIRRPGTDIFDAEWHNVDGSVARDVIRIARLNGNEVVLTRDGNGGVYYGTISPDGGSIVGTTSWYPEGKTWSGTIGGGLPSQNPMPDSGISTPDGGGNDVAGGDEPDFTFNKPGEDQSPDSGGFTTGGDSSSGPVSGNWKTPATSSSAEFTNNWNTATCDLTDTASLNIQHAIHLDRFELWIKWRANERSTAYRVLFGGSDIGGGAVRRGDCDPYQNAWCTATDSPDVDLAPGLYKIRIDNKAICQNTGSGGAGFIRASGH